MAKNNPVPSGVGTLSWYKPAASGPMRLTTVIRLDAGNDKNGNPRRVYCFFAGSDMLFAVDEGYEGAAAAKRYGQHEYDLAQNAATFATTPAEYRNIIRDSAHPPDYDPNLDTPQPGKRSTRR